MKSSIHLVLTLLVSILLSTHNALGSPRLKKRVANGHSDTTNIYKHEVRITTPSRICTGSIVSNWHVLTAAHCVTQVGSNVGVAELIEVTVGITQIGNDHEYQTIRLVEAIYTPSHFVHPPENSSNEFYKNNIGDIAVLKLNYGLGIGLDPRIEALKIPYQEYESIKNTTSNKLTFTGFGRITPWNVYDNVRGWVPVKSPTHLHYSPAQALPSNSCPVLGNSQFKMCAKLINNPSAALCQGDSGGALFTENESSKVVYGVDSYAVGECSQDGAYFTRVFPYVQFITNAANNRLDNTMTTQSYKSNAVYQKHLTENKYRYHWIYAPDVLKQARFPTTIAR